MDQQQELLKAMDVDVAQQTVVSDQLPDLTPVGIVETKTAQIIDDVAAATFSPKRPEEPKPDNTNTDIKMDDVKAETDPIKDTTDEEEAAKLMIFGEDEAEAKDLFTEPEKKKKAQKEEEEEVKEPPKKKKKVEEPAKKAHSSKSASKKTQSGKSASKKRAPVVDDEIEPSRKQPGHGMVRAEYVRLQRAMDALVRKRDQRLESNGGHAPTSVCSILMNNLIEYYEDTLMTFERKFGRYMV